MDKLMRPENEHLPREYRDRLDRLARERVGMSPDEVARAEQAEESSAQSREHT